MLYGIMELKGSERLKHSNNLFKTGEVVKIQKTGESVTIRKWQYVKNMKRFSYIVEEHPSTFYFEEEFEKVKSSCK
ncbi:hypothetical protein [Alkalihalobacillus sp. TS-13]|uniref:hypothetical protein n=1 Tax=Alkalihalobacillus sp. TS-13 TaxID=2842455 RepID=UPI0028933041|nr:hypothetical protein [Alkalihalobacillus sp. TS-13]